MKLCDAFVCLLGMEIGIAIEWRKSKSTQYAQKKEMEKRSQSVERVCVSERILVDRETIRKERKETERDLVRETARM